MRNGYFLRWLLFPLCLLSISFVFGKNYQPGEVKNYVVIGAFQFEENAIEWIRFSKKKNVPAEYRMNYNRGLFYVYSFSSDNFEEAIARLKEIWQIEGFSDAWVYTGNFGSPVVAEAGPDTTSQSVDGLAKLKETVEEAYPEDSENSNVQVVESIGVQEITPSTLVENPPLSKEELREEVIIKEENRIQDTGDDGKLTLEDFIVFFNLYDAQNNNDASGEVQVIDTERAKMLQNVKSGEYISVMDPNNGTGRLSLIVETFGYRKLQHEINYYEPLADTTSLNTDLIGDILVYHFPLVRYHKGDIATMYNVYFFKDAAIVRPESRYEINSLLKMMEENPNYKIRIHGHINGKSPGNIITAGEDKEWFALTSDDESGWGSAKKLSEERALVIKNYLVENGIRADRMEVKAWGGKRMLYDKHSSQAKKNIRVEIEILED